MAKKKITRKDVDGELLDTMIRLEKERKQIESMVSRSIESTSDGYHWEAFAQAKYLFLLREARHRNLRANYH
ncbi:MAG: YaaL family protein [Bacillota bacterium]|uniref:YaaL family protein n=1 Tax=Virgibacillus salarius TaxID=447199 RepID=A0A941DWJ6_9BACI|nr:MULTISPECIES: YaaL family protein [Bacillaceae]NAZ09502.1 DUF2508 family protein [Agaribacter marinus]MBR7796792.1 YaaL family protein [Virgibacillus salarius]MCC2250561.1 YaaL family protein [Virgibacillus sp. AGTR]MDY7045078.1 YaaL family protein [Virgibacillus sp. M23]QRZ19062.1 YaaL family protein [Virgibacillus sp. AGTR]